MLRGASSRAGVNRSIYARCLLGDGMVGASLMGLYHTRHDIRAMWYVAIGFFVFCPIAQYLTMRFLQARNSAADHVPER